ncbi:MAG TPA: cupin domain-containing protein [Burkholderiales bacterium]|nr:cupin domain-containing protein [Burkholderiales bacterium]
MTNSLPAARKFLAEFWHKKPLLARNALAQFSNVLDRARMLQLACRDDVESRLVIGSRHSWRVERGPFRSRDFRQLPLRNWTLLVNGLESVLPEARRLQQAFAFIPYARHDDVMASYAAPGGSVGPHFDSYDVALVQATGRRRWHISAQSDLELVAGAPLKILRRFRGEREWTVGAGDVLYLPPRCAHHGVALDECITWSVGFRAPSRRDMIERFLDFLRDQERSDESYSDPRLKPQRHAGTIGTDMFRKVKAMVQALRWTDADIERCLGEYLTEPRAGAVFDQARRFPAQAFSKLVQTYGVRLALPTRMLTAGSRIFMNSETTMAPSASMKALQRLADSRSLPPAQRMNAATRALLYEWYRAGYIEAGD